MDDYKIIKLSANSTSQCITQNILYDVHHELLRAEEIMTIDVCSRIDSVLNYFKNMKNKRQTIFSLNA